MAVWTVFEPDETKSDVLPTQRWADGVAFVREASSWSSVLFAPLVLLRHRLWLALIVYAVLQGLIATGIVALDLDAGAFLLLLLPNVLVALTLPDLRRRKLGWHGYEELGAVVAPDFESAERRFFEGWLSVGRTPFVPEVGPPRAAAMATAAQGQPVLGLFPEANAR